MISRRRRNMGKRMSKMMARRDCYSEMRQDLLGFIRRTYYIHIDRTWGYLSNKVCFHARNAFNRKNSRTSRYRGNTSYPPYHFLTGRTSIVDHSIAALPKVSNHKGTDGINLLWKHLDRATSEPFITDSTDSILCNHYPAVSPTITTRFTISQT